MNQDEPIAACKRCKNHKLIEVNGMVSNADVRDTELFVSIGDMICKSTQLLQTLRLENLPCAFVTPDFYCKYFNPIDEGPAKPWCPFNL